MFDIIDLEEALNDIFDYGLNNDNLSLVYKANTEVNMAVKTPGGLTDRRKIRNSVLQGDTFGSLLASVQVDTIAKDVEEAGVGLKYKNELPINILGLVDDIIGVTEAGYKAAQMNSVVNVKTAEKLLQFGVSKCKSMLIGKKNNDFLDVELLVDKWEVKYEDDKNTGKEKLVETFHGLTPIGKTNEQKYLGFVISAIGDNMANIRAIKKKSISIIQRLMTKLKSLNLMKYYFECSMIFLNAILRPSILYACETYYSLSEFQLRQLERIEESFIRKVFETPKSCPIVQLYLESGQIPARFEIQRMRLLFLQNILKQNPSSMTHQFFQLQVKNPTRGDWASSCLKDLKELKIEKTF